MPVNKVRESTWKREMKRDSSSPTSPNAKYVEASCFFRVLTFKTIKIVQMINCRVVNRKKTRKLHFFKAEKNETGNPRGGGASTLQVFRVIIAGYQKQKTLGNPHSAFTNLE